MIAILILRTYTEIRLRNSHLCRIAVSFAGLFRIIPCRKLIFRQVRRHRSHAIGWAQLFRAETWEQIQKLSKQNTFIRKAAIEMYELTAEDKIRIMLEEKRRIEMDYYSFMRRAKEEGMEKGMEEGMEKGTEKTLALINLLRPEELKELTGSSGDKQKEILARLLKKYQIE